MSLSPNPFKTIWLAPRQTVRRIVDFNPAPHVVALIAIVGINKSLDRASGKYLGDKLPFPAILAAALLIGPLGGLFSMWVYSHLIRLSGRLLGGIASREQIKAAMAWATVPTLVVTVLWIPKLLLFGDELFRRETPRMDERTWAIGALIGFAGVELVLGVWTVVLMCNTVAEVQGYRSAWRGLGNMTLAGACIVVPIALIAVAISVLR